MKIFVDTANLGEIEQALKAGFVRGITTNPALISKEPKGSFEDHIRKIIGLIRQYQDGVHLSVEVFSRAPADIVAQAKHFFHVFGYENLSVKVHVGLDTLPAIKELKASRLSVNCTCCMTVMQAVMAAAAGARYVSLFWGRIRDGWKKLSEEQKKISDQADFIPGFIVEETRRILDKSYKGVEIIAGSIRSVSDITDAGFAGADIVTVPPKFFKEMAGHFQTDQVVEEFFTKFEKWLS